MKNTLRLDPKDAHAYLVIGNSYSELGNNTEAIKAYKKGLTLNPKYNRPLR